MNKEWSEMEKQMQEQLKKETFASGIDTVLELRNKLMAEMVSWRSILSEEDYSAIPYINVKGYHSKTIAYSLWHIFRIEDIVLHSLILNKEEVFFQGRYQTKMNAPIITTGNELVKEQIADFSKQLDLDVLYQYIQDVKTSTDIWLKQIQYTDLKTRFTETDKERLVQLNVVSTDGNAFWLIDYWCNKRVKGLIGMPFSRHWIMHVEAGNRIKDKILAGR